jgi:hypothetical protein
LLTSVITSLAILTHFQYRQIILSLFKYRLIRGDKNF